MPEIEDAATREVRCPGHRADGEPCGALLWKITPTGIQIRHHTSARKLFGLDIAFPALGAITLTCTRCGSRWWPASPERPRPAALALIHLATPAHTLVAV